MVKARWRQMYQVSSETGSERGGKFLVRKRKRERKGFCFIKDIDCNGVSKWKGRQKKKRKESSILFVVFSEKMF